MLLKNEVNMQTTKKQIKSDKPATLAKISNKKFFIYSVIFIIGISFAIYANSIHNEFTNWDDDGFVVNNTTIRSLDFANIKRILTPHKGSTFQPIRVLSYAVDYHFWKLNPIAYHLHNILFHSLAGIFLFFTMVYLLPQIRGIDLNPEDTNKLYRIIALIVATLFIVHPVNVESVTWVTSRKYVELAFFTFVSFLFFIKSSENEKYHPLAAFTSFIFCVLTVLSSPFGVVTPGLFFLFDFCRDESNNPFKVLKKRWVYYLPYVVFCLFFVPLLWIALVTGGSGGADMPHPMNNPIYTVFIAIITMILFVIYQTIQDKKIYLFCMGWFLIAWVPASNIIPISTKMADRYVYIAAVGPFLFFTYAILKLFQNKLTSYLTIIIVIIFFSVQTIQRNYIWANSRLLWEDSLKKHYNNSMSHFNLGEALDRNKIDKTLTSKPLTSKIETTNTDKAIFHYLETIRINPNHIKAYNNVGILLFETKAYDKAISYFNKAITIDPDHVNTRKNLGIALFHLEKFDKAIIEFSYILEKNPQDAEVQYSLGNVYYKLKDYKKAYEQYTNAIRINSKYSRAHYNLGVVCQIIGKDREAILHFNDAYKLDPALKR
ncbi:MAG: hypothetical protein B6I31_02895 [Desulfobacteraceae bacterium 4572_19]|nr:MAG: hypothetical protein B6I31_02895 [Desulfobacteraceae bacterium 4572_19]